MKKRVVIIGIILLMVIIIGLFLIKKVFGERYSIITLDINPSIELRVDSKDIVVGIRALNNDAYDLISDDLVSKNIDDVITSISNEIIDKIDNREYVILLHVEGSLGVDRVNGRLNEVFFERHKSVNVIVPLITKEDERKAKKLNITPAKAAFLKEVTDSNDNLMIEDLVSKPVSELKEIKETGRYCDTEYTLEGDFCVKVISEERAIRTKVCPSDYNEIDGICYKSDGFNEELYCLNGQTLQGDQCVGDVISEASIRCDVGEYNPNTGMCESLVFVSEGTKVCGGDDPRISEQGTCTYPKPMINGGCLDNDVVINGWCYNMIDGGSEYPDLICPGGSITAVGVNGRGCYEVSSVMPTYYCNDGDRLDGNKCVSNRVNGAERKITCNDGYTSYFDRMCVDYSNKTSLVDGYKCSNERARLDGDKCIIYEEVEAKGR